MPHGGVLPPLRQAVRCRAPAHVSGAVRVSPTGRGDRAVSRLRGPAADRPVPVQPCRQAVPLPARLQRVWPCPSRLNRGIRCRPRLGRWSWAAGGAWGPYTTSAASPPWSGKRREACRPLTCWMCWPSRRRAARFCPASSGRRRARPPCAPRPGSPRRARSRWGREWLPKPRPWGSKLMSAWRAPDAAVTRRGQGEAPGRPRPYSLGTAAFVTGDLRPRGFLPPPIPEAPQEFAGELRRHRLQRQQAERPDRHLHLAEAEATVPAHAGVHLEPQALHQRQLTLDVVGDQLRQFPAGENERLPPPEAFLERPPRAGSRTTERDPLIGLTESGNVTGLLRPLGLDVPQRESSGPLAPRGFSHGSRRYERSMFSARSVLRKPEGHRAQPARYPGRLPPRTRPRRQRRGRIQGVARDGRARNRSRPTSGLRAGRPGGARNRNAMRTRETLNRSRRAGRRRGRCRTDPKEA